MQDTALDGQVWKNGVDYQRDRMPVAGWDLESAEVLQGLEAHHLPWNSFFARDCKLSYLD